MITERGNIIDGNWKWITLVSITIDVICIVPKLCWWEPGIVDRDWELRRRPRSGWVRQRWHPAMTWPFSKSSNRSGPNWNQLITYSLDKWSIIIVVLKLCYFLTFHSVTKLKSFPGKNMFDVTVEKMTLNLV